VYVPNVVLLSEVCLNLMEIDLLCCSFKSACNIKADPPVSAAGRETVEFLSAHLHSVAVIYPVSDIPLMFVSFPSAACQFTASPYFGSAPCVFNSCR
jgi:hypothetical protein